MSDKIKKVLQTPEVPEELKPENIPSLIRKNNIKKHNSRNIIRYVSALAACAVIALCAVNFIPSGSDKIAVSDNSGSSENQSDSYEENNNIYFKNISDYNEIYSQMKKNSRQIHKKSFLEKIFGGSVKYENADIVTNDAVMYDGVDGMMEEGTIADGAESSDSSDVYETIQQTEGIAEADIIKANSECIFYLDSNANLISIPVDSSTGIFGEKEITYLADDDDFYYPEEMYLNDNLLTVIVSSDDTTVVFVYDISSDVPELKDSYYQSGIYSDSRMKDSILYLTTNQFVYYSCIENEKNYTEYIPTCGNAYDDMQCIPSDDIYIPDGWDNDSDSVDYVNICGTDINNVSEPVSMISIAGYNGEMYCSDDNMYITQTRYDSDSDYTEITRFSFADGVINPEASGTVEGYVLNQFSMDEYDGYFRIATTSNKNSYNDEETWRFSRSNNIFVLDMDMNTTGSVTGIAETESIKSVTFSGNTGYIVTYQQTDPLFAIDFSDPSNPVITDEFKINGYSSFLYQWNDGLLLGFGIDADENGIELGLKLTMFDVSDNGDLKECGTYKLSGEYAHSVMSEAVYDRKALLLSRERNIIGFPVMDSDNGYESGFVYSYNIFSYNDGEFSEKGVLYASDDSEYYNSRYGFRRGIYIGDYIYAISDNEAVSADINSMNETDRISLEY